MELKDMILSTLAELEDSDETTIKKEEQSPSKDEVKKEPPKPLIREEQQSTLQKAEIETKEVSEESLEKEDSFNSFDDELHFCESMRERILVLFEGFQSPNNKSIEAKVDLTLNFLEYLLAVIDERLEILNKQKK